MSVSFLLMMLTLGVGVAEAGKLVYETRQTQAEVVCPDEEMQCPGDSSCCQLNNGQWGCCPHVEATCCADNVHCCPKDFSCDVDGGVCVSAAANKTKTLTKKLPASFRSKQAVAPPENEVCPGGLPCPGTCCKTSVGFYTCCPFSGCCGGAIGCCMSGYGRRRSSAYAAIAVQWSLIGDEDN